MREKIFKSLSVLMSLILFVSVISFPGINVNAKGPVDDFVERCYQVVLGRESDAGGKQYWTDRLTKEDAQDGRATGGFCAYSFLVSPEFLNKSCTNEQFVESLYTMFMNRGSDADGLAYWCGRLESGEVDRLGVIAGFINSEEFFKICENAGITAGSFPIDNPTQEQVAQMNQVNLFVDRMYEKCMGRRGDYGGQYYWLSKLLSKEITGVDCAKFFVSSPEFAAKNLNNEGYVEVLYRVFMGREYDDSGKAYWMERLENGMTWDEVFEGFAMSPEFEGICASYGINRGAYVATDIGTYDPNKDNPDNPDKPNFKVGDTVIFGKYEQDGDISNGKEDIEWQILSVEDGRILVISKYGLDYQPYNTEYADVSWETCTLRKWLNEDFYNTAFSENEKKEIPTVVVKNASQTYPIGGNNTKDKIFCLSIEEVEKYYGYEGYDDDYYLWWYNQKLLCSPTKYVINKGEKFLIMKEDSIAYETIKEYGYSSDVIGLCVGDWWLRRPGGADCDGYYVSDWGTVAYRYIHEVDEYDLVRPVMYIEY